MTDWHIAEMNVARALYPLDDPRLDDFMSRLDEINALADGSLGFVWRLQTDSGNATDVQVGDDPRLIVNMSVWRDIGSLFDFAYRSAHRLVMARRRQWFERPAQAYQVLWWVEAGRLPTVDEGLARLQHLRDHGPSPRAFDFKRSFRPVGVAGGPTDWAPEPYCVGWT